MNIDLKKLEINLNLHALQPQFLNLELHYIIAEMKTIFALRTGTKSLANVNRNFIVF